MPDEHPTHFTLDGWRYNFVPRLGWYDWTDGLPVDDVEVIKDLYRQYPEPLGRPASDDIYVGREISLRDEDIEMAGIECVCVECTSIRDRADDLCSDCRHEAAVEQQALRQDSEVPA